MDGQVLLDGHAPGGGVDDEPQCKLVVSIADNSIDARDQAIDLGIRDLDQINRVVAVYRRRIPSRREIGDRQIRLHESRADRSCFAVRASEREGVGMAAFAVGAGLCGE